MGHSVRVGIRVLCSCPTSMCGARMFWLGQEFMPVEKLCQMNKKSCRGTKTNTPCFFFFYKSTVHPPPGTQIPPFGFLVTSCTVFFKRSSEELLRIQNALVALPPKCSDWDLGVRCSNLDYVVSFCLRASHMFTDNVRKKNLETL